MKHFLLIYNREAGKLVSIHAFTEGALVKARKAVLEAERANPQMEVVLLEAISEEVLHLTHRRYFQKQLPEPTPA